MKQDYKKYKITCDWCRAEVIIEGWENTINHPEGWGYREVHNCGLTNYTRHDLVCPTCLTKPIEVDYD